MGIWSGIGKLAAARGGRMGAAVSFLGQRPDLSNALIGGGIGLATTGSLEGMFAGAGAGYLFGGRKGVARRDRANARLAKATKSYSSRSLGPWEAAPTESRIPARRAAKKNVVTARKQARRAEALYRPHSMGRAALGGLGVGGAFFALRSVGNSFGSITSNPHGVTFSGMGQPMYQ